MSLSMQTALILLRDKQGSIDIGDLGFILTVLRDNAKDDGVYETLTKILKEYF